MPNLDGQNYVILNSVANVSKAIDVLHRYERIHCLLDNDEAGHKASERLGNQLAENGYLCRRIVSQGKDWNDDLINSQQVQSGFEMRMA